MDLILENVSEVTVTSKYGNYANEVRLEGVDHEDVLKQIGARDVARFIPVSEIIEEYDHHELIEAIGDIEKFVEVFGRATILDYLDVHENEEEDENYPGL